MMKEYKPRPNVKQRKFIVKEADTLLNFLLKVMPEQSRTSIKSFLAHKQVAINGKTTRQFDDPIKAKDIVNIGKIDNKNIFSHTKINILFEDKNIIIVDKAHGLLVIGNDNDKEDSVYKALNNYVRNEHIANKVYVIHKIERECSGIVVFAKDSRTQNIVKHNWGKIVKEQKFAVIVEGSPKEAKGEIKTYITENNPITHKQEEKTAAANYCKLKYANKLSLLEFENLTHIKNQIRHLCASIACPIVGDTKFGAKTDPLKRIAIHANKLTFIHPITKKEICIETPIPKRFLSLLANNTNTK